MKTIDLNADIGESFGVYKIGADDEILEFISSANIACGFHAGDPATMKRTVQMALEKGVAIGAHPGLPDLNGFGRRKMALSPDEIYDIMLYQIGALQAFAQAEGSHLHHVKPHGALYNMAAKNESMALAIAQAIFDVDSKLILYGLSGSALIKAGEDLGLKVASEVFADRGYHADGSLVGRHQEGAVMTNANEAAIRLIKLIQTGKITAIDGAEIMVQADTVCLHGDHPGALVFAKTLYEKLLEENVQISALSSSRP